MLALGPTVFPTLGFSGKPYESLATRRPDEFGGWNRARYMGLMGLGDVTDLVHSERYTHFRRVTGEGRCATSPAPAPVPVANGNGLWLANYADNYRRAAGDGNGGTWVSSFDETPKRSAVSSGVYGMSGLGQSFFGDLSIQTLLLVGIGGWVAWKLFFGTTAQVRRRAMSEARKHYRSEVREIRSKYPRFG